MTKDVQRQEIIRQIQRLAAENDGEAPGQKKFASETGIRDHVWRGKIWLNWSDALTEAGFTPKEWVTGYDDDQLLVYAAELAVRLGHFPNKTELAFESSNNSSFPSIGAFQRRWKMSEFAAAALEFCKRTGNSQFAELTEAYLEANLKSPLHDVGEPQAGAAAYVYMQRYGADYKIGRTNNEYRRGRQIQLELPKEVTLIHSILTDDPVGVEAYWHKRFADKVTRPGAKEWFRLSKADIAAFKRWTKIW